METKERHYERMKDQKSSLYGISPLHWSYFQGGEQSPSP
jgi:hypothetical protein